MDTVITTVLFVFDLSGLGWCQSRQPSPLKSKCPVIPVIANKVKQSISKFAIVPDNNYFSN